MIKVNIAETTGYNDQQVQKIFRAAAIIERTINTFAFRDAILNFKRSKKKSFSFKKHPLSHFKKYSNEEVYDKIMMAKEKFGNIQTGNMDLYLTLIPGGDGITIGYGNKDSKEIFTYSEYFERATDASLANHIVHEWCHKIGFDHAFHPWQDKYRDYSVPYAVGNLIEQLALA